MLRYSVSFLFAFLFFSSPVFAEIDCGALTDSLPSNVITEGAFDLNADAKSACQAASPTGLCFALNKSFGGSTIYGWAWYVASSGPNQHWFPFNSGATSLSCSPSGSDPDFFTPDSDADGLPDACDAYPDDPSAYNVKRLSYQKDSSGAVVRECYYTDRGDNLFVCMGAAYSPENSDIVAVGEPWLPSNSLCSSSGGLVSPSA